MSPWLQFAILSAAGSERADQEHIAVCFLINAAKES